MRVPVPRLSAAMYVSVVCACGFPRPADIGPTDANQSDDASSIDAARPPQFLSCNTLAQTCGLSGQLSCCISTIVDGGSFYRGYDRGGDSVDTNMTFPATLSTFRLDDLEVTVGRFRAFVNAGMGTQVAPPMPGAAAHSNIPGSGWDAKWNESLVATKAELVAALSCDLLGFKLPTWTDDPGNNENRPMNCVTWYEAMAFCAWDGGYLPTEAEWNYAAAGGDQQRAYPWSNPAGSLMVDNSYASYNCMGDGTANCLLEDLVNVGTKFRGAGRWGQFDLAGNVSEWLLDYYADYTATCNDCAQLTPNDQGRTLLGGSFVGDATPAMRTGYRDLKVPQGRDPNVGFRCARTP
jgi:sulfatase modifying factor 1